ncbi:RNA-directed DNA polymerase [Nitrospira defluvii]|nr:RNA-directed DNA polymerase [Nitrospira defluvii]
MLAPPLLVSYTSPEDYLIALDPGLRRLHQSKIKRLLEQGLPPVVSSRCLGVLFGYSTKFINAMAQQNWKYYRSFTIRKGKKKRKIQAPKVALKVIQKWFGHHLSESLSFDDHVFGFVPGKSAPFAAKQHTNARWVYSVDISNFFPSTPKDVISTTLVDIGYSEKAAKLMSGLLCHRDYLAQGSPASPILSNLVFRELDKQLKEIAGNNRIRFTRYADDIVFSGVDQFPENIKEQVNNLFADSCWVLSKEKEYFSEIPKRLKVHGLLVHRDRPRLTKGYRNRIRAYKYLLETGQIEKRDLSRIMGHLNYAKSIDTQEK